MAAMAAAVTGCSGKPRQSGPPQSGSASVRTSYVSVPSLPDVWKPPSGFGALVAAATGRLRPVLDAFNATHAGLRATTAPLYGAGGTPFNPVLSVVFDAEYVGANLRAEMSAANWNPSDLWPGLIETVAAPPGDIIGVPVNFVVTCVAFHAAALRAFKVTAPSSSKWTEQAFLRTILGLARAAGTRQVFGPGLGFSGGEGPVWLGYATGHGGSPFSGNTLELTGSRVMNGLDAYAEVLRNTWQAPPAGQLKLADVSFVSLPATRRVNAGDRLVAGNRATSASDAVRPWSIARFPAGPLASTVPTVPRVAAVPVLAPDRRAGVAFVLWLLSRQGQQTLTSVGFPSMRTDVPSLPRTFRQLSITYADLVFVPGAFAYGAASRLDLDYRIAAALAAPPTSKSRSRSLRAIQRVTNQFLSGGLTLVGAMRALDAVVPARPRP